jgi:hypothetical protein
LVMTAISFVTRILHRGYLKKSNWPSTIIEDNWSSNVIEEVVVGLGTLAEGISKVTSTDYNFADWFFVLDLDFIMVDCQ